MLRAVVRAVVVCTLAAGTLPLLGQATDQTSAQRRAARLRALADLGRDSGGRVRTSRHPVTGAARFVKLVPGSLPLAGDDARERAARFLARYGRAMGADDPEASLELVREWTDGHGRHHLDYRQHHHGVPVHASALRLHFDEAGRLTAANGTLIPDIDLDPVPSFSASAAATRALADVRERRASAGGSEVLLLGTRLLVYREGLARRAGGANHLAWQVEVGNRADVREFVYVDAHDGKIVDRVDGVIEALARRVHEPDFDDVVIWNEGDALPYDTNDAANDVQVNGLIADAQNAYQLFQRLSGGSFPSWDGMDGIMHSVWKASSVSCPNATWNGTSTNFCDGTASDDVVAHEWTHAYTQSTHGLIYQWQPGALNESYSDIFGELVDLINGAGTDTPGATRTAADCSSFGGSPPPRLEIDAPAALAGALPVSGASFNPDGPLTVAAAVQRGDDGSTDGGGTTTDGCQALVGFVAGRIALVDRGGCTFPVKVANAESAGASGVIVVNSADSTFSMSGGGSPDVPAVMVGQSDGQAIAAALPGVTATIELAAATANSVRWLIGEDAAALGTIRDMWNPSCFGDPARVSDVTYWCSTGDGGGVHTNSGVPSHAFALLVDGGTFNGETVAALGSTRAAHVYWRAMTVYQVPDTDFADHADALEQSCADLIGVPLSDVTTGVPGPVLSATHCSAVAAAARAVELRQAPPCDFAPLLDPNPPALACDTLVFSESFETDPHDRWTLTHEGVYAEFVPRDWVWAQDLPAGGNGRAMFAEDDIALGNCIEGDDDQSGRVRLDSPPIAIGGDAVLRFDHWVATEARYDGGNLKLSVNGGPWELVAPQAWRFNSYNDVLVSAAGGNTNPLAGEAAFTGSDGGEVSGSWGQSHVDLAGHATAGDTLRLRFELGVDGCNGLVGWYVDELAVCQAGVVAGAVPDGSDETPGLRLGQAAGGQLTLEWSPSCSTGDSDYAVYEGSVGQWTDHAPLSCSTSGATFVTVTPSPGSHYYLVVPLNGDREGSYGTDSTGRERPPAPSACEIQALASCP